MLKSCLVVTASSSCPSPQVYLYPDPASGRPSMLYTLSISLVGNKAHAEDPLSKTLGTSSALGSRSFHECAHELFWGWNLSLTAHAHPHSPKVICAVSFRTCISTAAITGGQESAFGAFVIFTLGMLNLHSYGSERSIK